MKLTNSFAISILAMLLALLSGYLKLGTEAVIASITALLFLESPAGYISLLKAYKN